MNATTDPSFNMNGRPVYRSESHLAGHPDTLFIPLPPEAWRETGPCSCDICKRRGGRSYWDTLAVSTDTSKGGKQGYSWTVHHPDFHTDEAHRLEDLRRDDMEVKP